MQMTVLTGITRHPTSEWMVQMIGNAAVRWNSNFRFLR